MDHFKMLGDSIKLGFYKIWVSWLDWIPEILQPTFRRFLNKWCVSRDAALENHRLIALTHPTIDA